MGHILGQLNSITSDLHAADSVYHGRCSVNFRTGMQLPKRYFAADISTATKRSCLGRPTDDNDIRSEAFKDAARFLKKVILIKSPLLTIQVR